MSEARRGQARCVFDHCRDVAVVDLRWLGIGAYGVEVGHYCVYHAEVLEKVHGPGVERQSDIREKGSG